MGALLEKILDCYEEEEFLTADGFDEAIIGVDEMSMRLIYSTRKAIRILERTMDPEEAREYFDFNVASAFVGEKTPIWCNDIFY